MMRALRQRGQAMIEYTIVVGAVFLALAATQLEPGEQNMDGLLSAMKEHGRAYSYAVSLSDIPDSEDPETIKAELIAAGVPPEKADMMAHPDKYWQEFNKSRQFDIPLVGSYDIRPTDVLDVF
ncbi:MAG: hypothetical protein D6717_05510 [Gammaproteobacteria bacterium]|nr:MAG: hypothetical protein D6717_05510 [Gammaproteobacteria bacterium]